MSNYQRPWWLIVNKPAGLVCTVQEETKPGEQVFIIRGEPVVQGLVWLTWGPVAALLVVVVLAGLAINLNVKEQIGAMKALFVVAFFGLPAVAWGIATIVLNWLAKKHLQLERQAGRQQGVIRLNQERGELYYQTTAHPQETRLAYQAIRQPRISYSFGEQQHQTGRLTLDTDNGPVVLLNEELGTRAQKIDLADQVRTALNAYSNK